MATQPDLGGPMRLIEQELGTLCRNVEHELVTGLREKIHEIVRETFLEAAADSDVVSLSRRKARGRKSANQRSPGPRASEEGTQSVSGATAIRLVASTEATNVRMPGPHAEGSGWLASAEATHIRMPSPRPEDFSNRQGVFDMSDGVQHQGGSPPVPPRLSLNPTELDNAKEEYDMDDSPEQSLVLPNCVDDPSEPVAASTNMEGEIKEPDLEEPAGARTTVTRGQSSPQSSPRGHQTRDSMHVGHLESLWTSVHDEDILSKTGTLWAVNPANNRVARLVRTDFFDYAMGAVLVLNSLVIGLRVDWEASNLGAADLPVYVWTDRLFCVAFLTELGLRLYTFRLTFYITEGWKWAYFDTIVVGFQVLEEVVLIAAGDSGMNLGFLKMLKMGRLMRMVRMIRLLPELKSLVLLIMVSISSFMWTCFLLMLLVYMLAVYMVMMTVESLEKTIGQDSVSRSELELYWGSVGSAVLSCYWCITGGQDWAVVIGPLVEQTGTQLHNVVFAMFVAFATMVLMNLVTGVFVEGAQRLTREDRDKDLAKMAHKIFRMVDDDGSTEITRLEYNKHIKDGKLDTYLSAVDLDTAAADNLFELLDTDGTDTIDVHEFIEGCLRLRGPARSADSAQILLEARKAEMKHTKEFAVVKELFRQVRTEMRELRQEMRDDSEYDSEGQ